MLCQSHATLVTALYRDNASVLSAGLVNRKNLSIDALEAGLSLAVASLLGLL